MARQESAPDTAADKTAEGKKLADAFNKVHGQPDFAKALMDAATIKGHDSQTQWNEVRNKMSQSVDLGKVGLPGLHFSDVLRDPASGQNALLAESADHSKKALVTDQGVKWAVTPQGVVDTRQNIFAHPAAAEARHADSYYTVKKGDNLWSIAEHQLAKDGHGTSNKDILGAVKGIEHKNHLAHPDVLKVGQRIRIPYEAPADSHEAPVDRPAQPAAPGAPVGDQRPPVVSPVVSSDGAHPQRPADVGAAEPQAAAQGYLGVAKDIASGAIDEVVNHPGQLAVDALAGVGTAALAAVAAPEIVAGAAIVGAGYGIYKLATSIGGWLHSADVVANGHGTAAEQREAESNLRSIGAGATEIAAGVAGGGFGSSVFRPRIPAYPRLSAPEPVYGEFRVVEPDPQLPGFGSRLALPAPRLALPAPRLALPAPNS